MRKSLKEKLLGKYRPYSLQKGDYIVAFIVTILSLLFYVYHMHPSMSSGDNGELTVAMYYLGVAHAPSYPIHSLWGKLMMYLPIESIAWRGNFFSAFCASLTLFFLMLVLLKLFISVGTKRSYAALAASFGSLAVMMSDTFWAQAVMAEVYTISSIFPPLLFYILLLWQDDVLENQNSEKIYFGERYLLAYALLFGVGLGGHHTLAITEIFAGIHIASILIIFQILPHRGYQKNIVRGVAHLGFVLAALALAWGFYFLKLYARSVNIFSNNFLNTKIGMTGFVVANLVVLAYYLFIRYSAHDLIDPHNPYQKTAVALSKFFFFMYIGMSIYMYMIIRSHGSPPINWGGISEESQVWGKISKFIAVINRKQFPDSPVDRSFENFMIQLKTALTVVHYKQFSLPLWVLAGVGLVWKAYKYPLMFFIFTLGFVSFNLQLLLFLNFDLTGRTLSIIEVFFITSFLMIAIALAWGSLFCIELVDWLSKVLFLREPEKKQKEKQVSA